MKTLVKNALVGLCFAALILLVSSAPARAQVRGGSVDVAGYAGYYYTSSTEAYDICGGSSCPIGDNHGVYGFNGGYNITPYIAVIGEYAYTPIYSAMGVTVHSQFYGGGARINLIPKSKIVPYGIFTVGGDKLSESEGGDSASISGYSLTFGGGASCYMGKHWGIRPEFRYVRPQVNSVEGVSYSFNNMALLGGVFYQFGGHGK